MNAVIYNIPSKMLVSSTLSYKSQLKMFLIIWQLSVNYIYNKSNINSEEIP